MLGHGFIAIAQQLIDVGTISVMGVAQPAIAVCWAMVLLDEPVKVAQVPGMAVLLAGLIGFTLLQQRARPTVPTAVEADVVAEPVAGA
jgi:drug/metabolite transporter (DMT)-like permease